MTSPFDQATLDAVRWKNEVQLRRLLIQGFSAEVRDPLGHTPLILAAMEGAREIVHVLLNFGADPNARVKAPRSRSNISGYTALMHAAQRGHADIVRLLVSKGANVDARHPADGGTALIYASREGFNEIVQLLIAYGANPRTHDARGFHALDYSKTQFRNRAVIGTLRAAGASTIF